MFPAWSVLAFVGALLVGPAFAGADHTLTGRCDLNGAPTLGIIEVSGGSADTTFYVFDRNFLLGRGIWLYQESNGIWTGTDPAHDLQRGGESVVDPLLAPYVGPEVWDDNEICTDDPRVTPDQLIF